MLWLEPLQPSDAARFVETTPSGVRDVVLERAEGNPFFLEELVACFGEAGDLDAAAIPDSIHGVLAARIDQLPPREKEALQAASDTSLATLTTRIDALAVLGYAEEVEREAPSLLQPGTYVEPFALRALGIVRHEPTLVEQAIDRFGRLDLPWHATHSRTMA